MWVTELRLAEIQDVIPMSREGSAVIRHLLLAEGLSYVEDVPQWREVLNLHGVKVLNFQGVNIRRVPVAFATWRPYFHILYNHVAMRHSVGDAFVVLLVMASMIAPFATSHWI
jgi:hypothetical protein